MTVKINAFENTTLADETDLTIDNSGYPGGDPFIAVTASGSASTKIDTQVKYNDTRSAKLTTVASAVGTRSRAYVNMQFESADIYLDCLYWIPKLDPQPPILILACYNVYGNAAFNLMQVVVRNDGKVEIRDSRNRAVATSTIAINFNTWIRIALHGTIHTTTQASNVLEARIYQDPSGSISESLSAAGAVMGPQGGTYAYTRFGHLNASKSAMTMYIDWVRVGDEGWFGPPVGGPPPTSKWHWESNEPYGAGGMNSLMPSTLTADLYLMHTDVGGPLVSRDGMKTWLQEKRGLYLGENHKKTAGGVIALDPENTAREVFASGCGFNGSDPAWVESIDQLHTWVHKSTGVGFNSQSPNATHSPPLPKNPRTLQTIAAIDSSVAGPNGKGYRYAASFAKGIFRSIDGGITWTNISMAQGFQGTTYWYPRWVGLFPGDSNKLLVALEDAYSRGGMYRLDGIRTGTAIVPVRLSPVSGGGGGGTFNPDNLPVLTPKYRHSAWVSGSPDLGRPSFPRKIGKWWWIPGNYDRVEDIDGTEYNRSHITRFSGLASDNYALDVGLNLQPSSECWSAEASSDQSLVFLGGQFTTIGGVSRNRLCALDAQDGSVDPAYFSGFACNGAVRAMCVDNQGFLWVAGSFTSIGGVTRDMIAKLDVSTSTVTVTSVNVATSTNWIQDLMFDSVNNKILVLLRTDGTVGGGATCKVASLNLDGTVNWRANPNPGTFSFQLGVDLVNNLAYAATNGNNRTYAYTLAAGTETVWWHSDGNNQGCCSYRGHMMVGHHGDVVDSLKEGGGSNLPSTGFYCIDAGAETIDSWRPAFSGGGDAFGVGVLKAFRIGASDADGQICVTGDFNQVSQGGSNRNARRVALFNDSSGSVSTLINSIEEAVFDSAGRMYMACGFDGIWRANPPYTSGNWTDLDPNETRISKSAFWNAIGLKNAPASHTTLVVGCHDPVQVDANGAPGATSGIRYGSVYKITNAEGSPTVAYVSDPGTAGFPGGGDADINVNDFATGERFWRADDKPGSIPGRNESDVAAITHDPFSTNVWGMAGGGGIVWRSEDDGLTWRACALGVVIGSTMSISADPVRQGWFVSGNQDHDSFYTDDGGNSWERTPAVSDFTIGFNTHCDWLGHWYLCEGDDGAEQGRLMYWNGSGSIPSWTTIAGAPNGNKTGTTNGVPSNRCLAVVTGLNGGSTREVVWFENSGIWYRDNLSGSWTQASGFPTQVEDTDSRSAGHSLIWPERSTTNLYALVRTGTSSAGVWRSTNRGQTWTRIVSFSPVGRHEGFLTGVLGTTIYYTTGTSSLFRIRNAATTANVDTITSFDNPRAIFQEPATGRLLVWSKPDQSNFAKMWAVDNPAQTGTTLVGIDLFDPATQAFDTQGQAVGWAIKGVASNGTQIMVAGNGASVSRGMIQ